MDLLENGRFHEVCLFHRMVSGGQGMEGLIISCSMRPGTCQLFGLQLGQKAVYDQKEREAYHNQRQYGQAALEGGLQGILLHDQYQRQGKGKNDKRCDGSDIAQGSFTACSRCFDARGRNPQLENAANPRFLLCSPFRG
jgi:hypothetical protein